MKSIVVETEIAAAPAKVFAAFTDFEHAAGRIRAIESLQVLTKGPIGKGTRFQETRVMFGKRSSEMMEIIDFQPGKSYTVTAESCGARYLTTFGFEPSGSGTRVRMTFGATPVSWMAKLFAPLFGLMAGSVSKAVRADLEDLKSHCEGRPTPNAPAAPPVRPD